MKALGDDELAKVSAERGTKVVKSAATSRVLQFFLVAGVGHVEYRSRLKGHVTSGDAQSTYEIKILLPSPKPKDLVVVAAPTYLKKCN